MTSRDREAAARSSNDPGRPRRTRVDGAAGEDDEYAALLELGSELQSIELQPPAGFRDELGRRVAQVSAARRATLAGRLRDWLLHDALRAAVPHLRLAACALAVAVAIIVLPRLDPFRSVSAADVLTRAQNAIASRIGPGEVMFRRWEISERFTGPGKTAERIEIRYLDEWIDGGDIKHSAGKSYDASGHMYAAYSREREGDAYVQRVYYEPRVVGDSRGLLSLVPDRPQFEAAAARFSGPERKLLDEYLRRGYGPYEPFMREFRANETALAKGGQGPALAPVSVLLEKPVRIDRESMYRVRVVEPVRVQFRWTTHGPPSMWLDRGESVRYVSAATYLSQKVDTTSVDELGRRIVATRRVVDMRIFKTGTEPDPFRLNLPDGTPVREQSAYVYLTALAATLQRAAAFERAQTHGTPTATRPNAGGENN